MNQRDNLTVTVHQVSNRGCFTCHSNLRTVHIGTRAGIFRVPLSNFRNYEVLPTLSLAIPLSIIGTRTDASLSSIRKIGTRTDATDMSVPIPR